MAFSQSSAVVGQGVSVSFQQSSAVAGQGVSISFVRVTDTAGRGVSVAFGSAPGPQTGTISVMTNLPAATFAISGRDPFSGSGTSATITGAPVGTYTVTFGSVAGFATPAPQTQALAVGGTITFTGTYNASGNPTASLSKRNLTFIGFGIVMRPPWICSPTDSQADKQCAVNDSVLATPPATSSLTITNAGATALTFGSNAFSFSTADFALGTGADACSPGSSVAPGSQCTVYVTFNPQASALRKDALTISSNDPAGPQSVALMGTGMNVFYQFGFGLDPQDPDVPECFDLTSSVSSCGTAPKTAGYEAKMYGCDLSSTASALSTFSAPSIANESTSLSATTPASLDSSPPLTSGFLYDSSDGSNDGGLLSRNLQNWLESCKVTEEIISGVQEEIISHCSGAGMTLNTYLAQHIGNLDPVVLELCSPGECPSHYVVVVGPVPLAAPPYTDWVVFDPGWQAANQENNYLLSSHVAGFSTEEGRQKFTVAGTITFSAKANHGTKSQTISAYSPLQILITDSQGRQVGDVASGQDVAQIPGSSYFWNYPIADDTRSGAQPLGDPTGVQTAYIPSPSGLYQLQGTGTALGTFRLVSSAVASDGSTQTSSFNGITDVGAVAQYEIPYSPVPGATTQFSLGPFSSGSVPSSEISTAASGLAFSRVSQTFNGTVTIRNVGTNMVSGPLEIVFTSLTSGVTLANATGTLGENSFITIPAVANLLPGATATVLVQFKNPSNVVINFTPVVYSGSLN